MGLCGQEQPSRCGQQNDAGGGAPGSMRGSGFPGASHAAESALWKEDASDLPLMARPATASWLDCTGQLAARPSAEDREVWEAALVSAVP